MAEAIALENALLATANDAQRVALLEARLAILNGYTAMDASVNTVNTNYDSISKVDSVGEDGTVAKVDRVAQLTKLVDSYKKVKAELDALNAELAELEKDAETNVAEIQTKKSEITAKTKEVTKASNDAKKVVTDAHTIANRIYNATETLKGYYEAAKAGYDVLVEDGTTRTELVAELKTKVDALEKAYKAANDVLTKTLKYVQQTVYSKVDGVIEGVQVYEIPAKTETVVEKIEVAEVKTDKYKSDDDKIAYVEYENGVAFLLNFNNYAVRTEFNGTVYTIDAYDYLVIGYAD